MEFEHLQVECRDRVALVTIDRPDRLNALNRAAISALDAAFERLAGDGEVRAVVVTGAGDKAFVAGADIGEIRDLDALAAREFSAAGQAVMRRIERCPKPVIAAINGFALGGGLELALACHLRYAQSTARLGLPEIKLGVIPGFGGTQRLLRRIDRGTALEMMLTGEPIDAATAARVGLIQASVESGSVLDHALEVAARLAGAAPLAVDAILDTAELVDAPLDQALAFEGARFGLCCASEDMREGTAAFLEKRRPQFSGR